MQPFEKIKSLFLKQIITEDMVPFLERELFYLECNPEVAEGILLSYEKLKKSGKKTTNPSNSMVLYALGLAEKKPSKAITQSPTTLPDIDYDTDARDPIKNYLVGKYGQDKVSLLGTYNTLKTKGAIKDVVRQLRPGMSFDEVNRITKKFDLLKRTDFDQELEFYNATLEADPELRLWLDQNKDIADAVVQLIGNAKSTGIHAGGIVVSSEDIKSIVPLTYERSEHIWVTQPEMADVEWAGLIKYDFLGLNTLQDLNKCLKMVNERHKKNYNLSNIPLDDKKVFDEFTKGNTVSIFQFNTPLATGILTRLKSIDSINDLALITSIARPGPLNMGMDQTFIKRKNGEEKISYIHPSLEPHLKDTYSIMVYQEQVMSIVMDLGEISPNDSVIVLKAMGKKQKDKLVKFKQKFIANSQKKYEMSEKSASEIWDYIEAFAEYGFNKSHAIAYGMLSYICAWLKYYYPLEWVASVLSNASKDDFKVMYQHWNSFLQKPDVIISKDTYFIDDVAKKVVMPLSAVNGVGESALQAIVAAQPYSSFEDFYRRVEKRKVNRSIILNLVFAGCFDKFKPLDVSENKFRKELIKQFVEVKAKIKKTTKQEKEQDKILLMEVDSMTRGRILMKEIELLNFTAFDYHSYYKDKMTTVAKNMFGKEAKRPCDILTEKDKTDVVIGGAIETIEFKPIRTGKFMGKERAIIRFTNQGGAVEVIIFPWVLEQDDKAGGALRKITELTPMIIKGQVSIWNGNFSVIYKEGIQLA